MTLRAYLLRIALHDVPLGDDGVPREIDPGLVLDTRRTAEVAVVVLHELRPPVEVVRVEKNTRDLENNGVLPEEEDVGLAERLDNLPLLRSLLLDALNEEV